MIYSKTIKLEFIKIYAEYFGNISLSVIKFNEKFRKELGEESVTRRTYYNWRDNPEALIADGSTFADLISDADNVTIDNADFFLKAQTGKNNLKAICFFLKHKHPDYRAKVEISDPARIKAREDMEELKQLFSYAKQHDSKPINSPAEYDAEVARLRELEGSPSDSGEPLPITSNTVLGSNSGQQPISEVSN